MQFKFDLISDLNIGPGDVFDWEGKATSLYCVVPGNISSDASTILNTLTTLSKHYQGVFYIPGTLEFEGHPNIEKRTKVLLNICSRIKNVAVLYHNVAIIDGVAILGCNGWYGNLQPTDDVHMQVQVEVSRYEDLLYLKNSLEKLQKHLDVKRILLVTNSVPGKELYFGEKEEDLNGSIPLSSALYADSQKKVSTWVFGTYDKTVDVKIDDIHYINNSCYGKNPYWSKIVTVDV